VVSTVTVVLCSAEFVLCCMAFVASWCTVSYSYYNCIALSLLYSEALHPHVFLNRVFHRVLFGIVLYRVVVVVVIVVFVVVVYNQHCCCCGCGCCGH
jgi:hypothetical protein